MKVLLNKWYLFVGALIISILVSYFSINLASKDNVKELVQIFLTADNYDEKLTEEINKIKDPSIKKIKIITCSTNQELFYSRFSTSGLYSDILIIPKDYASEYYCANNFIPITQKIYDSYFINKNTYNVSDNIFGIEADKNNKLITYVRTFDFYIFFNKNSVHINDLNEVSIDNQALLISQVFLKHETI